MKYHFPRKGRWWLKAHQVKKVVMLIESKRFLKTVKSLPSWFNLGVESDRDFHVLKHEAQRGLDELDLIRRRLISFLSPLCLTVCYLCFYFWSEKKYGDLFGITLISLIALFDLYKIWRLIKNPKIRLNDKQELVYNEIETLLNSTLINREWLSKSEGKAKALCLKCLRNLAKEIVDMEVSLKTYPKEQFSGSPDDPMEMYRLLEYRDKLSQLYRLMYKFGLVDIKKGDLFKSEISRV